MSPNNCVQRRASPRYPHKGTRTDCNVTPLRVSSTAITNAARNKLAPEGKPNRCRCAIRHWWRGPRTTEVAPKRAPRDRVEASLRDSLPRAPRWKARFLSLAAITRALARSPASGMAISTSASTIPAAGLSPPPRCARAGCARWTCPQPRQIAVATTSGACLRHRASLAACSSRGRSDGARIRLAVGQSAGLQSGLSSRCSPSSPREMPKGVTRPASRVRNHLSAGGQLLQPLGCIAQRQE